MLVGNLRFVQDVSRTGKLWIQFMGFRFNHQDVYSCWTDKKLWTANSSSEKCCCILLLPAMTNIQSQFKDIFKILRICVLAWKRNIKRVLSPYTEIINFSGVILLLTRSLNKHWRDLVSPREDWSTLHTMMQHEPKWLLSSHSVVSTTGFDWSYHGDMVWTTSWCPR